MIDIENELFTMVKTAVQGQYPAALVMGSKLDTVTTFPAVSFVEVNNRSYQRSRDSGGWENHARVMYEVEVFSNCVGKKQECKRIIDIIDTLLIKLGFNRLMSEPILNLRDLSIARRISQYEAVVGKNHVIYGG